ncbi:MAG: ABC transporter permease [Phycisphaerales bacterium]
MDRTRPTHVLLLLIAFAVLGALLLYPIWLAARGAFLDNDGGFTLYHIQTVFTTPRLREGLINALLIAVMTTALSLIFALPLAMLSARYTFPGKGLLSGLVLIPLILPPFVGAIGLYHLAGRAGTINTILLDLGIISESIDFIGKGGFWAVVLIEALHLYPIIYLNATAALANLDPALEEAAENLGASRWRRLRTIVLPLVRPGLFAGSTIVFIWSFTELGTPLMFEYHDVTPVQIFNGIREMEASAEPYALTVILLLSAVMCYLLGRLAFGGRAYEMYSKASIQSSAARLRALPSAGAISAFVFMIGLAALPHAGVILASLSESGTWYQSVVPRAYTLDHFEQALTHPLARGSIRISLLCAGAAVVLDLVLGLIIAHLLVRTRVLGRGLLDALSMLPLAVPGLVIAFGYVAMTLEWPFTEGGPLHGVVSVLAADPNPIPLLIIAYAIRRLPYVVRSAVAGLQQTARELEEASLNLGASRMRTLRVITMPLIAANLIAGALLAFSFAMLEVSDSLILAQREEHFPITKAMYVLFQRLGDGEHIASAMGVWGMALLTVTLVGAAMLMGKKMGAIFRV